MSYENWKIKKSELEDTLNEYETVAGWCNESGEYRIEEINDEYCVVKNPEPTQEEIANQRIAELKKQLADTDYIAVKIAEGAATKEEYANVIAQRQAWRDEINELQYAETKTSKVVNDS